MANEVKVDDIRRVDLGTFVRPGEETGTGESRVEAVYGYAIPHGQGLVLLDTGLGEAGEETEARYRPRRIPLGDALKRHGMGLHDIDTVVNCHLHFDHCGGNSLLAGRPVMCQRAEMETARAGGYTVEALIVHPGARYELLDGEAEILPGVHIIPTPGHVDGHQSLVIECDDGSVVAAGQSHDTASAWSADVLASRASELGHTPPLPVTPAWMDRLLQFDPRRVDSRTTQQYGSLERTTRTRS